MSYRQILLVEDDTDDQYIFIEALKIVAPATICTIVCNGQEALDQLRSIAPDIIFSDINLPVMNGIELLKQLNQLVNRIPIIMMSTSTYQKEVLMNLGADHFFVKPTTFELLCLQLEVLLA